MSALPNSAMPKRVLHAVALITHLPADAIATGGRAHDLSQARHLWVYLLVQFLPRPARLPARACKTRAAGDQDGNIKPVARFLGWHPAGVRYALKRIEDRREDPAFDAMVARLEKEFS